MLHAVLIVLKIIGLILLAIIGLLLLLVLLVLFIPVRYKFKGIYNSTEKNISGSVYWLFHILHISINYEDELKYKVKIFGFTFVKSEVDDIKKDLDKDLKQTEEDLFDTDDEAADNIADNLYSNTDKDVEKENHDDILSSIKDDENEIFKKTGEVLTHEPNDVSKQVFIEKKEREEKAEKEQSFIAKLKNKIYNFFRLVQKAFKNFTMCKDFITSELTKTTLSFCKASLFKLLNHIKPRRIKGHVDYGLENPANTGYILGLLSVLSIHFPKNKVRINPNFEQSIMDAFISIKGRAYSFILLRICWKLYRYKKLRLLIKQFRKLLDSIKNDYQEE